MSTLKRSDKLAFLAVSDGDSVTCHRLRNFTEFSVSKNPVNYSRQYIDEDFERNDVVGYAPSVSYSFDYDNSDEAHKKIVKITDDELCGDKALVELVFVDLSRESEGAASAVKRAWSAIPDKEGSDTNTYNYSGTFRANGDKVLGTATSSDNWQTCTFSAL